MTGRVVKRLLFRKRGHVGRDGTMGKKIIIIGGGVAGLSAGIYLQRNGYDTEILEMHRIAGGQCTAWERRGYRFDYCLHWLVGTAFGPFHDLWRETGVITDDTEIINHEVHTRIVDDNGEDFIVYTDIDRWEEYLIDLAPEDMKAIRKMCGHMRRGKGLLPFTNPPELRTAGDYLRGLKGILPALPMILRLNKKNCRDYFRNLGIRNPRISMFFETLYGARDFSAVVFVMMLTWFNQKNAGYLIGGSLPLAQRMAEKYRSLGGRFTGGTRVETIIVERDRAAGVRTVDGHTLRGDCIISAADGHATIFDMLGGKYLTERIREAYGNWGLFTPLVQVSFGIDRKGNSPCPVQTHMTRGRSIGSTPVDLGYSLTDYSFDPTMAPEGKSVMVMRFESPWDLWNDLEGEAYGEEKARIAADATALLESHHPGIGRHIEVTDVATPKTGVRHTGVWKGSYEGFMPSPRNYSSSIAMTLPGLDRFYMIGQWLYPGGGIPPAVQSGRWVAQLLCKNDGKKFLTPERG
ncbi:MAG: NAD(P)/FAD-dependent oxidoreductase [Spirochaetes bacterium]|nr:NAD(P)/FAD-dependent oxidoreductase [Spirochaetota bacterium]